MRRAGALALLVGLILAGCGGGGKPSPQATTRVEVIQGIGAKGGFDAQKIYRAEAPGVVTVVSLFGSTADLDKILGGDGAPGGGSGSDAQAGEGSGFVLNGDGDIVTNAHVVTTGEGSAIKRAQQVYVEFADGNRVQARILGDDPNADVALLRVDPKGLTLRPLPLGASKTVAVGQPVAAIGSPFGQAQSLSVGVVSALDRSIKSLTQFAISGAIQTDAAINPGNSGGPLVGADGRVIGINQQIETKSGGGEGVGFAVPIDVIKRSLGQLRETGNARYAYLGVAAVTLYPQLVTRFKLGVAKGAWLQQLVKGGPADRAGLRAGSGTAIFQASSYSPGGDVITKVDGHPIDGSDSLAAAISDVAPGATATIEIRRDGATKQVRVKLGDRPLASAGAPGG